MIPPPLPHDETERLAELESYGILDTDPEPAFDRVTRMAVRATGCPASTITLVDQDRQWFKSEVGFGVRESTREHGFCAHAILSDGLTVVPDAAADERFRGNPLVAGEPHIRFYAAAPLKTSRGRHLGTVCVVDFRPRPEGLTPKQAAELEDLAVVAAALVEQRAAPELERELAESQERYRLLTNATSDIIFDLDVTAGQFSWSGGLLAARLGYADVPSVIPESWWSERIHPEERQEVEERMRELLAGTGEIWEAEYRFRKADGNYANVFERGFVIRDSGGRAVHMFGSFHDMTPQRRAEREVERLIAKLESERAQLETLIGNLPVGVAAAEAPAGRVLLFTRRMAEIAGCPHEGLPDLPDIASYASWGAWAPDGRLLDAEEYPLARALRGEHVRDLELCFRRGDGETVWASCGAAPIVADSGEVTGGIVTVADVTEREKAHEALRAAQRRLEAAHAKLGRIMAHSLDVICTIDAEGRFVEASPAALRVFGREPSEMEGVPFGALVHPGDAEKTAAEGRKVMAGHSTVNFENRYIRKDGSTVHLLWSAVWSEDDQLLYAIARDVTERARAERLLCESNRNLAKAQKLANVGSWSSLVGTDRLTWSDQVCEIFGIEREEFGGTVGDFFGFVHPDDREIVSEQARQLAAGELEFLDHEYRIIRPGGAVRVIHGLGERTIDPESGSVRVFGTVQDITERVRAAEALTASEARYRALFDHTPHAIWVSCCESLRFLAANQAALELFGYSGDELLAMTLHDIRLPLEGTATGAEDSAEPWPYATSGGEIRHLETHSYEVKFGDTAAVLTHAIDVTRRVQLAEQLRHAQKLEAVGQLAGGVAHDFNNLLTVINGYSHALLEEARSKNGRTGTEELEQIARAGDRAAKLTRQLLAFGRKQLLQPKLVDLSGIVTGIGSILRRLLPENIELDLDLHVEPLNVRIDPSQMEQVLLNLAVNARDAMKSGGILTIKTRPAGGEAAAGGNGAGARERSAVLAVSDTGHGIPPEDLPRLFEPFFTTKGLGGTGLGLPMVYGIVRQSGGAIRVESRPGQGATFEISFPSEAGPVEEAPAREAARPASGRERILLVEDDASVRGYAKKVLERLGYKVLAAQDAEEGLAAAAAFDGKIDLLISDIVLPGRNGRSLAQELTKTRRDMKVLLISGYTPDETVQRGADGSEFAFLAKPFDPDTFASKIREVLDANLRPSVLVVDDEDDVRRFFAAALRKEGYEVHEAPDGLEAMRKIARCRPNVVVLDLVMPEQEGIETITAIRRRFDGVKVLAVSGAALAGLYLECASRLGADAALAKPVSAEDLAAAVTQLAGRPAQKPSAPLQ